MRRKSVQLTSLTEQAEEFGNNLCMRVDCRQHGYVNTNGKEHDNFQAFVLDCLHTLRQNREVWKISGSTEKKITERMGKYHTYNTVDRRSIIVNLLEAVGEPRKLEMPWSVADYEEYAKRIATRNGKGDHHVAVIAFDLETTDRSSKEGRIVEIAGRDVLHDDDEYCEFTRKVCPGERRISNVRFLSSCLWPPQESKSQVARLSVNNASFLLILQEAMRLTGLTNEELHQDNIPSFPGAMSMFRDWVEHRKERCGAKKVALVGHNCYGFDAKFLQVCGLRGNPPSIGSLIHT